MGCRVLYTTSARSIWANQGRSIVNFVVLTSFVCFTYLKFHYTHNSINTVTLLLLQMHYSGTVIIHDIYVCPRRQLGEANILWVVRVVQWNPSQQPSLNIMAIHLIISPNCITIIIIITRGRESVLFCMYTLV